MRCVEHAPWIEQSVYALWLTIAKVATRNLAIDNGVSGVRLLIL
jgi:hypothetical protein